MINPETTDTSSTTTGNTPPPPPPVELSEAIIKRIQSFLNGKEAAQTTLLSKSWYNAWLTRPNLDFDVNYFARKFRNFWNFVNKTVERYEKLNLQIDSLRLCIYGSSKRYSCSNVSNLITKALNMGATCLDLNVFFNDTYTPFTLPHQVFGSENLITLSARWCKIDGKVSCSRLKSLTLDMVRVEGDIIWDIISSCPLIENLSLTPWNNEFGTRIMGSGPFNKLKCLLLSWVKVHSQFFNDFSSKFPCLKDLSIHHCRYNEEIQISSASLECISFKPWRNDIVRVEFDVPCIRKFTFSGYTFPSLTVKTTSRNWESSIYTWNYSSCPIKVSWILQLKEFLKKLSQSKVSLSLIFPQGTSLDHDASLEGLTKLEVENLTISGTFLACLDNLHVLFQLCRPIYITQYWFPDSWDIEIKKLFIGKLKKWKLVRDTQLDYEMHHQVGLDSCTAYQRMFGGECDLEEVSVEFYDESVSAWHPRLSDTPIIPEGDEDRVRIHLTWRRH